MRILFANATHRWGGVKSWTLAVGRGLIARGHSVEVVLRPGDAFGDAAREAGFTVSRLAYGPDWNPVAIGWFHSRLRGTGAELLVTNVGKDNRTAGAAARLAGVPVLHRVGREDDLRDRFAIRWAHRNIVSEVLVPSRATREALLRFDWIAPDHVTVIPSGIDLERFRPGPPAGILRNLIGAAPDDVVLATTSQLTPVKGHRVLLEALASGNGSGVGAGPVLRLAVVGTGPEKDALSREAEALGLSGRVHFVGFRRDLPELLTDVDIAVQPSRLEGLPHSVLEFMGAGRAIVASRIPGIDEAIQDGRSGLLVPPDDPGALGDAIARLANDPARRRELGEAARKRALEEFAADTMIDRVEALMSRVAREKRRA